MASLVGRIRDITDMDWYLLHVLIDKPIAVLACANAKRDADIANCEPEQSAVQHAQQVKVVGSETVGGVCDVNAGEVSAEPRPLADIGEDDLRRF